MNKGIWLVLALGTAGAVGCSSSSKGTVEVTWAVTANGVDVDCADVGADSVEIVLRRSSGTEYRELFTCADGRGQFRVPEGQYTLSAWPLDSLDRRLFQDGGNANVTVVEGETTPVGVIEFAFEFGTLTFRVHMGSASVTGGNCNPTNPNNGAGVALEEISIVLQGSTQCIPFSLTGVTNENNQPVTEEICDTIVCQPESAVHTVTGLQDGQYRMAVFGRKGATSSQNAPICYVSNEMPFTISGGNTVNLGTIFAPFDTQFDNQNLCNATKPTE
jgi:hypothetical protein